MGLSADDKLLLERIEEDFKYHPPTKENADKHIRMRQCAKGLARLVIELCPESHERHTALTKIEEAAMWANAAIARKHDES